MYFCCHRKTCTIFFIFFTCFFSFLNYIYSATTIILCPVVGRKVETKMLITIKESFYESMERLTQLEVELDSIQENLNPNSSLKVGLAVMPRMAKILLAIEAEETLQFHLLNEISQLH